MTDEELAMLDMDRPAGPPMAAAGQAPAGLPPEGVPAPTYVPPPAPAPLPPPQARPQQIPPPSIPDSGLPPPTMAGPATSNKSVTDRESTVSRTAPRLDPSEKASMLEGKQAERERERLALQQGDVDAKAAAIKAEEDRKKADLLARHGEALKKLADDASAHVAERQKAYDDAFDAYKNAKPTDFWADDTDGRRKMWAGVAMALGGLSERSTGGRNTAYEMIKGAVDRHDALEQARIAKMRDVRDTAGKAMEWEFTKKHEAQADAAAWKANALESAAAELDARVGQLGPGAAALKAQETAAKLRQDAAVTQGQYSSDAKSETRSQVVTKTQQIVGGAGAADKPINQWKPEERKAEGFAMRAHKASEEMDRFKYTPPDMKVLEKWKRLEAAKTNGGLLSIPAKAMEAMQVSAYKNLSPEGKKRYNATREFIISGLRPESGAAISLGELADAEQRYGTVPGDTKDTAPQKRQNRMAKIAEVGIQSGRPQFWIDRTGAYGGGSPAQGGQQPAQAQQPQQGEVKQMRNKRTGEIVTVRRGPDGQYYPVDQVAAR